MTTATACSFCAKRHDQVAVLVTAIDGSVAICNVCVGQADRIIRRQYQGKDQSNLNVRRLALGGSITTEKGDRP
ncbi:MAG: ClpX C4-type zinc finger protein [Alphaproteobacteria bacterium]|nr:MAG: ClpX C4-type zinc finger protein [Alphaproteobacteria bacterium]